MLNSSAGGDAVSVCLGARFSRHDGAVTFSLTGCIRWPQRPPASGLQNERKRGTSRTKPEGSSPCLPSFIYFFSAVLSSRSLHQNSAVVIGINRMMNQRNDAEKKERTYSHNSTHHTDHAPTSTTLSTASSHTHSR
jgi:hypothetical protein